MSATCGVSATGRSASIGRSGIHPVLLVDRAEACASCARFDQEGACLQSDPSAPRAWAVDAVPLRGFVRAAPAAHADWGMTFAAQVFGLQLPPLRIEARSTLDLEMVFGG